MDLSEDIMFGMTGWILLFLLVIIAVCIGGYFYWNDIKSVLGLDSFGFDSSSPTVVTASDLQKPPGL